MVMYRECYYKLGLPSFLSTQQIYRQVQVKKPWTLRCNNIKLLFVPVSINSSLHAPLLTTPVALCAAAAAALWAVRQTLRTAISHCVSHYFLHNDTVCVPRFVSPVGSLCYQTYRDLSRESGYVKKTKKKTLTCSICIVWLKARQTLDCKRKRVVKKQVHAKFQLTTPNVHNTIAFSCHV